MPKPEPCWIARVWREHHARNLSRTERDVLLTLATFRARDGIAWPAHTTLAERVRCSVRSVQRALAQGARLGLIRWTARRVRAGWRSLQTSNAYRFTQPITVVRAGMRLTIRRIATAGHQGRGGERKQDKEALKTLIADAAKLPDLLAARRRVIEERPLLGR